MLKKDRYLGFDDLSSKEVEGTDYRIRWRIGSSGIAVLSIHGGGIEPGTSEIAEAIASTDHTFYTLEGIKGAGNLALHITSTVFDEHSALEIISHSELIVSVHGCADEEPLVYLGGLDVRVRERIREGLSKSGFNVIGSSDSHFTALNQKNICNLCDRGMGVQLEVSRGLRLQLFEDLYPRGKKTPTETFHRFILSVREAIAPFGAGFADEEPEDSTD